MTTSQLVISAALAAVLLASWLLPPLDRWVMRAPSADSFAQHLPRTKGTT